MNKKQKKRIIPVIIPGILLLAALLLFGVSAHFEEEKRAGFCVPDVVSSRLTGDECHLTVVANGSRTDDRRAFAERVVEMYEDNAFYTTRFSRDGGACPMKVYMDVYPEREDVGNREPQFRIIYDVENGKIDVK